MPVPGEAVAVVIIGLAALLSLRLLIAIPGWVRHARTPETRAIRVVGVGGGGSNAVDRMVDARTRARASWSATPMPRPCADRAPGPRSASARPSPVASGPEATPRSAGVQPRKTRRRSPHAVAGADLVFVTAGLGGGTGSGAAPIVAANARDQGALTIAVVTKPFGFEGSHRMRVAEAAAAELAAHVDALIVVPNDRVADVLAEDASMIDAFGVVDDVLHPGGPGDHRPHHRTRPDQSRLCRCPVRDAGRRSGAHRPGSRDGRAPRHGRGASGHRQPAAGGQHRWRPRDPLQRLRPAGPPIARGARGRRGDPRSGPTPTRT